MMTTTTTTNFRRKSRRGTFLIRVTNKYSHGIIITTTITTITIIIIKIKQSFVSIQVLISNYSLHKSSANTNRYF